MQVRIALSGPGGSGKSYIVSGLRERLEDMGYRVAVLTSTMRHLSQIGYVNNQEGNWQSQIASAVLRQIRQRELSDEFDFVLSDRAMSCELGYAQHLMEENYDKLDLMGDKQEREVFRNILSARDMIRSLWSEDSLGYWDHVYLKEIHPKYPPEADGAGRVADLN